MLKTQLLVRAAILGAALGAVTTSLARLGAPKWVVATLACGAAALLVLALIRRRRS